MQGVVLPSVRPGGQHRNKTETGVRLLHLPTGIRVQASERRSQSQNRQAALERLAEKLEARSRRRKSRIATDVPAAEKRRRLERKKRRSEKKRLRGRPKYE